MVGNVIISNKNRAIKRTEQWRKDNLEHFKKYNKKYYLKNRKKKLAYSNKYHQENREKCLKYMEGWRERNPEYHSNYYIKTKLALFKRE